MCHVIAKRHFADINVGTYWEATFPQSHEEAVRVCLNTMSLILPNSRSGRSYIPYRSGSNPARTGADRRRSRTRG